MAVAGAQKFPPTLAEQEAKFIVAMLDARRRGSENFVLGVVTTPCTERPFYVPSRPLALSGSSPAQGCVDAAGPGEDEPPRRRRRKGRSW